MAVRLQRHPLPAMLGALVALLCLTRLALEAAHHTPGIFESLGPLAFITLIATLGTMSIRGLLAAPDTTPVATS